MATIETTPTSRAAALQGPDGIVRRGWAKSIPASVELRVIDVHKQLVAGGRIELPTYGL